MTNIVRFDCFEVDLDSGELRKRGIRIRLRDQSFQVLASLLENVGRVVSREELRLKIWHEDVFVDFDNNLNILVARLREALNDSAKNPRFVETLPKHGYRFIGHILGNGEPNGGTSHRRGYDPIAYNEYVEGRRLIPSSDPRSMAAAREHLKRAIVRDPNFALAYDAMAELYWYMGYTGTVSSRDAFQTGIMYALRALEIDNSIAETHALLAQFHKTIEYNWAEVHREMQIALELNPNSPLVHMRFAISELMPHGRLKEAIEELERALEMDPLSTFVRFWLGIILLLARQPRRAADEAEKILELDGGYFLAYFVMSNAQRYMGCIEEAIESMQKATEGSGRAAMMLGWFGLTLGGSGRIAEARSILEELHEKSRYGHVPASSMAWVYLGLGEIDKAFGWMDRAVDECDQLMMPIKSYVFMDPLRGDARFNALLRKMRLDVA